MKEFYSEDIKTTTISNTDFRRVVYTGRHLQLVLMALKPGEEIGSEVHEETDQFFRIEEGTAKVIIDDNEYVVSEGGVIIVPSGARHNVSNTSEEMTLTLYTLYAPPHHKDQVRFSTKKEAEESDEEFDGQITE